MKEPLWQEMLDAQNMSPLNSPGQSRDFVKRAGNDCALTDGRACLQFAMYRNRLYLSPTCKTFRYIIESAAFPAFATSSCLAKMRGSNCTFFKPS
mmetsp:Transcript_46099/g.82697  ORF Transcript_46099/g.82697 Transcript_46099/m.82697 type:complete len:95 (-) Transcript_46099:566-850(-)